MLSHLRSARLTRALVALAAVLCVTTSVGLHAEPGDLAAPHHAAGLHPAGHESIAPAHSCLLCLLYGSVLLASASTAPAATLLALANAPRPLSVRTGSVPFDAHEGRAPPRLG